MGKRELLLIAGFLLLAMVAYRATAPPTGPDEAGLSISRLLDHARREIGGHRASTTRTTASTIHLDAAITALRVTGHVREVHISGEERADIEASLRVVSNAYNDEEARQYAEQTVLVSDQAASSVVLRIDYPKPGQQITALTLKVPARLLVHIDSRPGTLTLADLAAVEAADAGGETTIRRISGRVALTHRGGPVVIEDVASLRFAGRNSRATVKAVRGDASITLEQGATLTATQLGGTVDIESRNAEVILEDAPATAGAVRVSATRGSVVLRGVAADTRLDARNARVDVWMAQPAPLAIHGEAAEVTVTAPAGGHQLDVLARSGGQIVIEGDPPGGDLPSPATTPDGETRLTGSVDGGGPTIAVRNRGGRVVVRYTP